MSDFTTDPIHAFESEREKRIASYAADSHWKELSSQWLRHAFSKQFVYNFSWLGRPVIQSPNDLMALQELIWATKPELVVETGVAHGGSLIFYASMMQLMGAGEVIGIDIDIRAHNRTAIESHPMAGRIRLLEGSSTDSTIIHKVQEAARNKRTMVVLDSNHTHAHVLGELRVYAPLVSVGCYCVVLDTVVEDLPQGAFPDRPWDVGNNPKTAVHEYLALDDRFAIDEGIVNKLQITLAPDGYLRRVK